MENAILIYTILWRMSIRLIILFLIMDNCFLFAFMLLDVRINKIYSNYLVTLIIPII